MHLLVFTRILTKCTVQEAKSYPTSCLCNYVIINIYQMTTIWFPFMSLCTLKISTRGHMNDLDAAFVHTRTYEEHIYFSGLIKLWCKNEY
jgi:hypothetical protein